MANEKSIAVLPFDNMSSDPENEYFSDGMTEEIINALSRIEGLLVTARTSSFVFKHHKEDIRKIGKQLGVSLVLEGSIRKAGDRVRITAQLIRSDNGFHIWSENYDRQLLDIFAVQDEISLLIADKIREHFGHLDIQEHLVDNTTNNITAYELFLKGRFHHNKWDISGFIEATKWYEKSIQEDPSFDLPYFGAGLSYSFLSSWGGMEQKIAFDLAEKHFIKGLALKKSSLYSYYCTAKHLFWAHWNYKEAFITLLKAYEIDPQHADTNEFLAEINTTLGDFSRALSYIQNSLASNPLSPNHFYTKANIYYLQGQYELALIHIEQGLKIAPNFTVLIELMFACLIQLGQKDRLLERIAIQEELAIPSMYEFMFDLLNESKEIELNRVDQVIQEIQEASPALLFGWDLFLLVQSKQLDKAMDLLESRIEHKVGQFINFKHDPFLRPLHHIDRFNNLVNRTFPDNKLTSETPKTTLEKERLSPTQIEYFSNLLLTGMDEEKYYLSPDLSLKDLAKQINLHPNNLSWLLNNKLGKNFYEFVNAYRLKEFQMKAIDPRNQHLSLLGLAYDSGFNSKSVFNDYFKKSTGTTPKKWTQQNK